MEAMTEAGLEDITAHFLYKKKKTGKRTPDMEHGEGGKGGKVSDGR